MFTYRLDQHAELRLLDLGDAKEMFKLVDSNRAHLREWLSWVDKTRSEADSRVFIEGTRKQFADGNGFQAGIWYKGELAGVAGFHGVDRANRKTEMGYWLAESYQGKGLMTKTCKALIDHAFNQWELNKVIIRCGSGNHRSCAIPERLGFSKEGWLREEEYVNDHYVSHYVYGLLRSEWAKNKSFYELESARKELLRSIEDLSDEALNAKLEAGRWSIGQVVEHLHLIESGIMKKLQMKLAEPIKEPARKKRLENVLDRSVRFQSPEVFEPTEEKKSRNDLLEKLAFSRSQFLEFLKSIEDWHDLEDHSMHHPALGTLDLTQWVELIGLHERRHTQQIIELKAKL